MKNIFTSILLLFVCNTLYSSCQLKSIQSESCIQQKIRILELDAIIQTNKEVWQYEYLGMKVYFIPSSGGDQMSELFDKDCELICHPDGGMLGTGDGRCSDFFDNRKNGQLIWSRK